jgi:hypothetical protein
MYKSITAQAQVATPTLTESRLMQNCYMWIHNTYPQLRGLYFEIHNNAFSAREGARHKAMGRIAGVADACLLLPAGRGVIFFEFKSDHGRQSIEQKEWQKKIQDAGYYYYIINSETQFRAAIIANTGRTAV